MTDGKSQAEMAYHLSLLESEEGFKIPHKKKRRIPGGNQKIPAYCGLIAPNPDFWEEDMPSWILGILDETVTNGYRIRGVEITLLCDGTELGKTRARYAKLGLVRAGAVEIT